VEAQSTLAELVNNIEAYRFQEATTKMLRYEPYPYQLRFHNAKGHLTDEPAKQRFLMAGNGTGKTLSAAMETSFHATGLYPDWWEGTRFHHPTEIIVGAKTNDAAVKVVQKELFGETMDKANLGTGTIPLEYINKQYKMKPGVPGAIGDVLIKHVPTGRWSKLSIMSYDQKAKAFMGTRFDVGWLDEEPPSEIWSQFIRGTLSRKSAILYITATPEEGMTQVVLNFTNDLKPGQALITATWDDAPHLTEEEKEQRLAAFPPHEREMRSKGIPMMGAGLIFPFSDDDLVVEPMEIPSHWPQITGIDFGGGTSSQGHPFAAARLAWDRDTDTTYLCAEYRVRGNIPTQHADVIKKWGDWIPVAWPHDGLNTEKGTGKQLRELYAEAGLKMLREKATNPPDWQQGQKEGEGGYSRERGLLDMYRRMEDGKFKVFSTCKLFLEEKRMYHRDENGKVVSLMDDLISATRYAHMMLRHAHTRIIRKHKPVVRRGYTNW
jgi:phage terminase large subunit-like protein